MLKISKTHSYSVPVVERTCDILELLSRSDVPLKSVQISDLTRVPRSTTYRILRTLVKREYLTQDLDGGFSLARSEIARLMATPAPVGTMAEEPAERSRRTLSTREIVQILTAVLDSLSRSRGK
jgi:DNA-binding IclR family transcriptional regulator